MAATLMCLVLGISALVSMGQTYPTTASTSTSSKCTRMPASSAYQGTCYFQYVKGRGMVREQCPYGTRYNEDACECISVSRRGDDTDTSGEDFVSPAISLMHNKAKVIQSLLRNVQSGALERLLKRRRDMDDDNEGNDDRGRGNNDNDDNDDRDSGRSGLGRSIKSGAKSFLSRILGMFTKGLFQSPSRYSYIPRSRYSYNHRSQMPRTMADVMYPSRGDDFGEDDDPHDEKDDNESSANYKWSTPSVGGTTNSGSGVTGSGNAGVHGGKSNEEFGDNYGDIMKILFHRRGFNDWDDDKNGGGLGGASTSDDGGLFSGGRVISGNGGRDDDKKSRGDDDMDGGIMAKIHKLLAAARGRGNAYDGGAMTTMTSRDNDVNDNGGDGGYSHEIDDDRKTTVATPKHGYTSPYSIKGMLTRVKDYRFEDLLDDIFADRAGNNGVYQSGSSSGGSSGNNDGVNGGGYDGGSSGSYDGVNGGESYSTDDKNNDNGGGTDNTQGSSTDDGSYRNAAGSTVSTGTTNYGGDGGSSDGNSYTSQSNRGDGGDSTPDQGYTNYGAGSQISNDRFDANDDDDDDNVFDDYEGIYEKKFDGVLEYVNKLTNDIFNDDFDDFYEDLFDDDGYDDCFDDKYGHIFDENYEKEIDDKYDDIDTFFSRRGGDGGNDINNDNTGNRGAGGISGIDDKVYDDKHDDQGVDKNMDDNDDTIWSGSGKFDIYDNLFDNMKTSGTQDSRLFNFGETLKRGAGSVTSRSDDGIFDEFYRDL